MHDTFSGSPRDGLSDFIPTNQRSGNILAPSYAYHWGSSFQVPLLAAFLFEIISASFAARTNVE